MTVAHNSDSMERTASLGYVLYACYEIGGIRGWAYGLVMIGYPAAWAGINYHLMLWLAAAAGRGREGLIGWFLTIIITTCTGLHHLGTV